MENINQNIKLTSSINLLFIENLHSLTFNE